MAKPVGFHRVWRMAVTLNSIAKLVEVELAFEKTVDPESGMTLNLVEVDQLQQNLKRLNFANLQSLLLDWRDFFDSELATRGARLKELAVKDLFLNEEILWSEGRVLYRSRRPARLDGSGGFRQGEVTIETEQPVRDLPQNFDIQVANDSEMMERLKSVVPAAFRVVFRESKSGDFWRWQNGEKRSVR